MLLTDQFSWSECFNCLRYWVIFVLWLFVSYFMTSWFFKIQSTHVLTNSEETERFCLIERRLVKSELFKNEEKNTFFDSFIYLTEITNPHELITAWKMYISLSVVSVIVKFTSSTLNLSCSPPKEIADLKQFQSCKYFRQRRSFRRSRFFTALFVIVIRGDISTVGFSVAIQYFNIQYSISRFKIQYLFNIQYYSSGWSPWLPCLASM